MSIRASTSAQRLNDRVRFERAVLDDNGDITSWRLLGECAAAVDGAKAVGAERVVADGTRSVGGYTVWVRSEIVQRWALTVADRAVWLRRRNGLVYLDVKDAPDQGLRGRLIGLVCEAGVNRG
jgi:head-tail adaptor